MTDYDPVTIRGSRFTLDEGSGRRLSIYESQGELSGSKRGKKTVNRVTVTVQPENPKAIVSIDPPDAQPDVPGHQVDLPAGQDTTITVTTTSPDGTSSVYSYTAERSS